MKITQMKALLGRKVQENLATVSGVAISNDVANGGIYVTRLKLDGSLPINITTAGGGNAKAGGVKIAELPKGRYKIIASSLNLSYKANKACTVNPEVGVGTLAASKTEATLGADDNLTEDIVDGQALGAFTGTTLKVGDYKEFNSDYGFGAAAYDGSATAPPIYLNIAGNWGASADFLLYYQGYITIVWCKTA